MEKAYDPTKKLTSKQRATIRGARVEDVNDFIEEMICYCDDEEDLIALGALLQVVSKNILTAVMDKKDWKYIISRFLNDVDEYPYPDRIPPGLLTFINKRD